jgi:hypothetical protein
LSNEAEYFLSASEVLSISKTTAADNSSWEQLYNLWRVIKNEDPQHEKYLERV